ncbi:MAG: response regulator [Pseudomonadota bacterium]
MMTKIAIADAHTVVRAGLRRLLDEVADFAVVAEAASGEDTLRAVRDKTPDCLLMDAAVPGLGGLETTRRLHRRHPDLKIVGMSARSEGPLPMQMMEAGACGYLSKSCTPAELVNAVHSVTHGQRFVNAEVASSLVASGMDGRRSPINDLSSRELQVLLMVSQAHSQSQIANQLCISPKTVSTYRTRVCRKLEVNSDVELVHMAVRYGLLEL